MPFVNELISTDDKVRLKCLPGVAKSDGLLWKWTVDRELSASLFTCSKLGGGYEGTADDYFMCLEWGSDYITFRAEQTFLPTTSECNPTLRLKVRELSIPAQSSRSVEETRSVISNALVARGWLYDHKGISGVHVEFI